VSEGAIQKSIVDAFETIGVRAIRVQSGIVKVRGGWMHLAPEGTPDIMICVPPNGRALFLEVKTRRGKESGGQTTRAQELRALGALVHTVRSVEEAVAAYREAMGALR
jgi:hypothetical protein